MSGIDTSQGINSVASQIAAFDTGGVTTITTNTGAQVSGLEAAAYEFGSILASYPTDAPKLVQDAPVFQVMDANGNTSMVSLSDLSNDIQKQTGFNPLIEFAAGSGINGFSVSDINAILTQIQNQFSTMTFSQLAMVEGSEALQTTGQLTSADQTALGQLGNILNGSTPSLTQVVTSTPGGLDPDAAAFLTPAALSQVQTAQSNVSNLNGNIDGNLTTVQNSMTTIQAIQSAMDGGDTTGVPANIAQDIQNLQSAQIALQALTMNPADAALSAFSANLSTGLTTVLNAGVANNTGGYASYDGIMTGATAPAYDQSAATYHLPVWNMPGYSPINGNQLIEDLTSLAAGVQNAFGSAFQTALAASANGTVDASDPVFTGPSGNLESFNDVLNELQNGLPPILVSNYSFTVSGYMQNAFGGGVPSSFSASSVSSLTQTLSTAPWTDPNTIWHAMQHYDNSTGGNQIDRVSSFFAGWVGTTTTYCSESGVAQWDSSNPGYNFPGLMHLCGYDSSNPSDVSAFKSMLNQVMPGASQIVFWSQSQIQTLQQDCGKFSFSTAQGLVTQYTTTLNTDANAAINTAKQNIATAQGAITSDNTSLSSALSSAMQSTKPALSDLQNQITTLQGEINTDQTNMNNAQASLNALTNAYADNPSTVLTAAQQTELAGYQQAFTNAASDMQQKQAALAPLQNQLLFAAAQHQSLNDILGQLHSSTGLDLSQVLQGVVGNGLVTPAALNELYTYINQNQPAGRPALPLISNTQLLQAAATQLQSMLSQSSLTTALQNGGTVDLSTALFTLPGSTDQVSFSQAVDAIQQGTGVDLQGMLNRLIGSGPINASNLQSVQSYLQSPLVTGQPSALVSATVNGQTITGQLAAEYNFANQLTALVPNVLSVIGGQVPISTDTPIFAGQDANGNQISLSLNQVIQNAQYSGFDLSSLLPPGQTGFNFGDLAVMIQRLNQDQTNPTFQVSPSKLLDAVVADKADLAAGISPAVKMAVDPDPVLADSAVVTQVHNQFSILSYADVTPLTVGAPSVPVTASDSLLNYSLPENVQDALAPVVTALNQLAPADFDANGNLSFTNALFNVPSISANPVSMSDIFAAQLQNTGIDLSTALNGLVTPASANSGPAVINSSNLSNLIQLLNQALPQGSVKGSSISGILQANFPPNSVTPTLTAVNNAVSALATLPNLPFDQNSTALQTVAPALSQQVNTWLTNNPEPNYSDDPNAYYAWKNSYVTAMDNIFLNTTGLYGQTDPSYAANGSYNGSDVYSRVAAFTGFVNSSFVQGLEQNWGLPSFSNPTDGTSQEIYDAAYAAEGPIDVFSDSWFGQVEAAVQRAAAGTSNPDIQAASEILGVNPYNNTPISGTNSLAAQLGISIPANPTAADLTNIYNQIKTKINTIAPNFVFPASVAQITAATLTGIKNAVQGASNVLNAVQIAAANQIQGTVGSVLNTAQSVANLVANVPTAAVTVTQSSAAQDLISYNTQLVNLNNGGTPYDSEEFLEPTGIYGQIVSKAGGDASQITDNDATLVTFSSSPFIQDLENNWGLAAPNLVPSNNPNQAVAGLLGNNQGWWSQIQQAMQRKVNAIQSPNNQPAVKLLGINPFDSVSTPGSLAAQLGIIVPTSPTAADANSIYKQLQAKLATAAPNFAWPASISDLTPDTLNQLKQAVQANLATLKASGTINSDTFSITAAATNLQNIQFEDIATAVQSGQATASETAAFTAAVDHGAAPVLTATEMDSQLASGNLYVSTKGAFYLNGQPTNPRDASVAAFVIGGNSLSSKLNNLMNQVNTRNTNIQIMNYLSAATSASDLATRISTEKAQYGYSDVLSQVTGGALSDGSMPTQDSDVTGTTGSFQGALKTAIDNDTKNQDLDTQNLQQLTTQVQSNNTAITQMIQAYEQILKSVAQNFE